MDFRKFHNKSVTEHLKKQKSAPKRKAPIKVHEPVYASNFMIKTCRNPEDFIDRADWEEEDLHNMVFIKSPGKPNGLEEYLCFRKKYEGGPLWKELERRRMAKWVQNPEAKAMDEIGHGGMPSTKDSDQYVQLLPNNDLVTLSSLQVLKRDQRTPAIYMLKQVHDYYPYQRNPILVRYGNVQGSFGVSQIHGQHPPQPVYELIRSSDPRAHVVEEKQDININFESKAWNQATLKEWMNQVYYLLSGPHHQTHARGEINIWSTGANNNYRLFARFSDSHSLLPALESLPLPTNTLGFDISGIVPRDCKEELMQLLTYVAIPTEKHNWIKFSGRKNLHF